jgi:hypothetical protein
VLAVMPLADILAAFRTEVAQCNNLIAHAHALNPSGQPLLPIIDQKQITIAAFLNMFISWETFLECAFMDYMTGASTIGGRFPVRYVSPSNAGTARAMVIGTQRYFDYANHDNVKKIARMFFENGDPFEPHISSMIQDLADLRTMRNASAHVTSTTQTALESLALRTFGQPKTGIDLYQFLTAIDPRSNSGDTVFAISREKLLLGAELIAQG